MNLELLKSYLEQHPEKCEEVLNIVSTTLAKFRENAVRQSTALADASISSLACFVDYQKVVGPEFLLDAVIHECRLKNKVAFCNSTRKMVQEFKKFHEKTVNNKDSWIEFVKNTRGQNAQDIIKWVLQTEI